MSGSEAAHPPRITPQFIPVYAVFGAGSPFRCILCPVNKWMNILVHHVALHSAHHRQNTGGSKS